MNANALTHPGLARLGSAYEVLSAVVASTACAMTGWSGWQRASAVLDRWGHARVEALAMQDPRVRNEILAAALRQEKEISR